MRVLFRKQPQTRSGIVFLKRVLTGRNYVAVVVIFITFWRGNKYLCSPSSGNVPCFSRRPTRIYLFRLTCNYLRRNYFYSYAILSFFCFRDMTLNYLVSTSYFCWTCLTCELQASLADNIHTHYVDKSLWTRKQNHFSVELNKTYWFHCLKISP